METLANHFVESIRSETIGTHDMSALARWDYVLQRCYNLIQCARTPEYHYQYNFVESSIPSTLLMIFRCQTFFFHKCISCSIWLTGRRRWCHRFTNWAHIIMNGSTSRSIGVFGYSSKTIWKF